MSYTLLYPTMHFVCRFFDTLIMSSTFIFLSSRTSKSYYFSQADSSQAMHVKIASRKQYHYITTFGILELSNKLLKCIYLTLPLISSNIGHSFLVVFSPLSKENIRPVNMISVTVQNLTKKSNVL